MAPAVGPSQPRRSLLERVGEQGLDRLLAVLVNLARPGAGEMGVRDLRHALRPPVVTGPAEPAVLLLVEHAQRLVAQLRELGAPAGAAAHRAVVEDHADDVDFLAAVDLIPDRLQDLAQRRAVGVAAVHQPADVFEADVAGLELLVVEYADAAPARFGV